MIIRFVLIATQFLMSSLVLTACSSSGGGDDSSNSYSNIKLGTGKYAGYYEFIPTYGKQSITCLNGMNASGQLGDFESTTVPLFAITQSGDRISAYDPSTYELAAAGYLSGSQYYLNFIMPDTTEVTAILQGNFTTYGWNGKLEATGPSDNTYCTVTIEFSGSKYSSVSSESSEDYTSRNKESNQSEAELMDYFTSILKKHEQVYIK